LAELEQESKQSTEPNGQQSSNSTKENAEKNLSDDPWQDLLGDD
jgi:hypothetical protein